MSVELKELVPGAIVVDLRGNLAIITGPNTGSAKYPVLYKLKTGTRGYKGSPVDFKAVLGVVSLATYKDADKAKEPLFGSSESTCPDFLLPEALKGVKKGDIIEVRHGYGSTKQVVYDGYNINRPKYPLSYVLPTGGRYKGPASAFIRKVRDGVSAEVSS